MDKEEFLNYIREKWNGDNFRLPSEEEFFKIKEKTIKKGQSFLDSDEEWKEILQSLSDYDSYIDSLTKTNTFNTIEGIENQINSCEIKTGKEVGFLIFYLDYIGEIPMILHAPYCPEA